MAVNIEWMVDWCPQGLAVHGRFENHQGQVVSVMPISVTILSPELEGTIQSPAMVLDKTSATSLMNALWDRGVRPNELKLPEKSTPTLEATKLHLEDMRKIVFDLMELKK